MKRSILVFLFSIISLNMLWAQNDFLDLIKDGKLEKVDKKVDKILRKTPDDINANYCKALVLTQKDYSFYNPDSAYKYITKAKELFSDLKNAFPCIIANIRTYSDFIPLEYEMFDLVIIDEASQVSIAQALPAIFRAKKVIVL